MRALNTREKAEVPKPTAQRRRQRRPPRWAARLFHARAQVRVFQDFAAAKTGLQLTPGQVGALLLIEANQGLSQSQLGAALGIDRPWCRCWTGWRRSTSSVARRMPATAAPTRWR